MARYHHRMTVADEIEAALGDPQFAPALAALAARWGADAPRALLSQEITDWRVLREIKVCTAGPLAWVRVHRLQMGYSNDNYVHTGGGFRELSGRAALEAILRDGRASLSRDWWHVMTAYEAVADATVARDPVALESPALMARYFEQDTLLFQAVLGAGGEIVEVRVDANTYEVRERAIGRGAPALRLVGRDYAGPAGSMHATLIEGPVAPHRSVAPVQAREALARAWREIGLGEHASVASFARTAMELMAVGAPLDLVRRTHEAALDEIRHAHLAFAIAAGLDGRSLVAGPLPALAPREATLARVALDTLREAALPETLAAAEMYAAAASAIDPALGELLRGVAADEARHAALAWDTVAWCGERVRFSELLEHPSLAGPPERASGAAILAGHGFLPAGEAAALNRSVWQAEIAPRLASLREGLTPSPYPGLRRGGTEGGAEG